MSCCDPKMETCSFEDDRIIVGGEINTHSLPILAGQVVARGDVLTIDAAGKLSLIAPGAEADAHAIAAYAVDATAADTPAEVYVEGRFDQGKVNLNGADLALTKAKLSADIQLVRRY